MKSQDANLELIRRSLDGDASNCELAELESLIRDDVEFRKEYLRYLNVDMALSAMPKELEAKSTPPLELRTKQHFPKWRPFTAAAAGLAVGLFCASVAWAITLPRETIARIVLPVLEESFEDSAASFGEGFPAQAGVWGGDQAKIETGASKHQPLGGGSVLRLAPSPETTLSYIQHIIDVEPLPAAMKGETRTLEVVASFLPVQFGERERYTLRVATFKELPGHIRELWEGVPWQEMGESTLTMIKSGLSTTEEAKGWQTISASIEVPRNARGVVISLAAGRLDPLSQKTHHYIDDVRADLVIAPKRKRSRKKHR